MPQCFSNAVVVRMTPSPSPLLARQFSKVSSHMHLDIARRAKKRRETPPHTAGTAAWGWPRARGGWSAECPPCAWGLRAPPSSSAVIASAAYPDTAPRGKSSRMPASSRRRRAASSSSAVAQTAPTAPTAPVPTPPTPLRVERFVGSVSGSPSMGTRARVLLESPLLSRPLANGVVVRPLLRVRALALLRRRGGVERAHPSIPRTESVGDAFGHASPFPRTLPPRTSPRRADNTSAAGAAGAGGARVSEEVWVSAEVSPSWAVAGASPGEAPRRRAPRAAPPPISPFSARDIPCPDVASFSRLRRSASARDAASKASRSAAAAAFTRRSISSSSSSCGRWHPVPGVARVRATPAVRVSHAVRHSRGNATPFAAPRRVAAHPRLARGGDTVHGGVHRLARVRRPRRVDIQMRASHRERGGNRRTGGRRRADTSIASSSSPESESESESGVDGRCRRAVAVVRRGDVVVQELLAASCCRRARG